MGCPPPSDLVTLLRGAPDAALRRHVEGCAACTRELQQLTEGYSALAPADDGRALGRIERAVAKQVAAVHAPPVAALPPRRRLIAWGLAAALLIAAVALVLSLLMAGLRTPLPGAAALLLPVLLMPALGWPPRRQRLALAGALAAVLGLTLPFARGLDGDVLKGAVCLLMGAIGLIGPALLLWWGTGAARRGALPGALLGAAACSGGLAVQSVLCPMNDLAHLGAWHVLPFYAVVALFAVVGRRMAAAPGGAWRGP